MKKMSDCTGSLRHILGDSSKGGQVGWPIPQYFLLLMDYKGGYMDMDNKSTDSFCHIASLQNIQEGVFR